MPTLPTLPVAEIQPGHPQTAPSALDTRPSLERPESPEELTDTLALVRPQDEGCPHDGLRWWQRCSGAPDCVCPDHLRACLDRFISDVLGYLLKRGVDRSTAVEAVSSIYIRALQWAADGTAAAMSSKHRRGCLCRAALNIARDLRRRSRRGPLGKAMPIKPGIDVPAPPAEPGPLEAEEDARAAAAKANDVALLMECFGGLPDDAQRLLFLRICEGKSQAKTARAMGWTVGKVRSEEKLALGRLTDAFLRRRRERAKKNHNPAEPRAHSPNRRK